MYGITTKQSKKTHPWCGVGCFGTRNFGKGAPGRHYNGSILYRSVNDGPPGRLCRERTTMGIPQDSDTWFVHLRPDKKCYNNRAYDVWLFQYRSTGGTTLTTHGLFLGAHKWHSWPIHDPDFECGFKKRALTRVNYSSMMRLQLEQSATKNSGEVRFIAYGAEYLFKQMLQFSSQGTTFNSGFQTTVLPSKSFFFEKLYHLLRHRFWQKVHYELHTRRSHLKLEIFS